jgi:hypothetical protein
VLDDAKFKTEFNPSFTTYLKIADSVLNLFSIKLTDYIPQFTEETELGVDQVIRDSHLSSTTTI